MTPSPEFNKNNTASSTSSNRIEGPKFLLTIENFDSSSSSKPQKAQGKLYKLLMTSDGQYFYKLEASKSSQCSSLTDGESYECFGENDQMTSTDDMPNTSEEIVDNKEGVDLDLVPQFQRSASI